MVVKTLNPPRPGRSMSVFVYFVCLSECCVMKVNWKFRSVNDEKNEPNNNPLIAVIIDYGQVLSTSSSMFECSNSSQKITTLRSCFLAEGYLVVMHSCRALILFDKNKFKSLFNSQYFFSPNNVRQLFWESDPKSQYKPKTVPSRLQLIKDGYSELKNEFKLFGKEVLHKLETDPILLYQPGVIDKQWEIHKKEHLDQWTTTCDSDHGEGFSTCDLTINNLGKGLFSGYLNTEVPKDGVIKRAGYCSARTKRVRKSFKRDDYLNWGQYTHLVIKCRGDGRSYMLNIGTSGYFDQLWNDIYHYVLYTRGGPYWQITKIPFSKFFFSSKGRIQDLQCKIQLNKITHFGITASDKINGPFSLEIDYIGVEYDPLHMEEFAYEMYRLPKNIAAN